MLVLGGYFLLQMILRALVSPSAELDESEQLLFSQAWQCGYGSDPPLYPWLQILSFDLLGTNVLALAFLKNLLLFATFVFTYAAAKGITGHERTSIVAAVSLLLFPQITWESQRDLTHTVLATTMAAGTFYVAVRVWRSRAPGDYLLLGLVVGLGTLSKYNYCLVALALALATLGIPELRRVLLSKWTLMAVAVFALVTAPHFWWALHRPELALRRSQELMGHVTGNPVAARALGLLSIVKCIALLGGVITTVFGWVFFWGVPKLAAPTLSQPPFVPHFDPHFVKVSKDPSIQVSKDASIQGSKHPSVQASKDPSIQESKSPSAQISNGPSGIEGSENPGAQGSKGASIQVSKDPRIQGSKDPSVQASDNPSFQTPEGSTGGGKVCGKVGGGSGVARVWIQRTFLWLGLFWVGVVLAMGIELRDRWLQPVVSLGALWATLLVSPRLNPITEKRFALVIGCVMLIVLSVLPGIPLVASITKRPTRLNAPYAALATQLKATAGEPGVICAATRLTGGNLRLYFPKAVVIAPEFKGLPLPSQRRWLVVWDTTKSVAPPPSLADLVKEKRGTDLAGIKPFYVEAPCQYIRSRTMKLGAVLLPR